MSPPESESEVAPVRVTVGLVDALLELAADAEPREFEAPLGVTPAGEFEEETGLSPDVPVFTDLYMGGSGSVSAVFGMDLSTPPGTRGRFISHPDGHLGVSEEDTLHEVVLVAVPPWDKSHVAAFDRSGRERPLTFVDAAPPEASL